MRTFGGQGIMVVLFSCADPLCEECQKNTLSFVSVNKEEAAKHSADNHSKMWISDHPNDYVVGVINTYNTFVNQEKIE